MPIAVFIFKKYFAVRPFIHRVVVAKSQLILITRFKHFLTNLLVTGAVDIHRGTFRPFNGNPPVDCLVKRLKTGFTTQQKIDFVNDRTLMSRFFHENILRFEGSVMASRPMMIVSEYMEHPSVDEFLRVSSNTKRANPKS